MCMACVNGACVSWAIIWSGWTAEHSGGGQQAGQTDNRETYLRYTICFIDCIIFILLLAFHILLIVYLFKNITEFQFPNFQANKILTWTVMITEWISRLCCCLFILISNQTIQQNLLLSLRWKTCKIIVMWSSSRTWRTAEEKGEGTFRPESQERRWDDCFSWVLFLGLSFAEKGTGQETGSACWSWRPRVE